MAQGQQHQMNRQQVEQAIQSAIQRADSPTLYDICKTLGDKGQLQMNGQNVSPAGEQSQWQKGDQFQFASAQSGK